MNIWNREIAWNVYRKTKNETEFIIANKQVTVANKINIGSVAELDLSKNLKKQIDSQK